MSKRVSNKKGASRKTPARSRVRYGWRKRIAMELRHYLKMKDLIGVSDEK